VQERKEKNVGHRIFQVEKIKTRTRPTRDTHKREEKQDK
jgi:hypothetical protein